MDHRVVADYTGVTENEQVQCFVRFRPPADGSSVPGIMFDKLEQPIAKKLLIRDPGDRQHGEVSFQFDRIFDVDASQQRVFDATTQPLVDRVFAGYNGCVFAYGQTGSGKTYSMFGEDDAKGLIPRSVEYIFQKLMALQKRKETAVVVSFLEIYCDHIRDLGKAYLDKDSGGGVGRRQKTSDWYLKKQQARSSKPTTRTPTPTSGAGGGEDAASRPQQQIDISGTRFAPRGVGLRTSSDYIEQDLKLHEDMLGNVYVRDAQLLPVSTPEEVLTIVQMGFKLRATHETKLNAVSSRSHTVFTITIVQKDKESGETVTGMLNLVDLAGSERLGKSESVNQRMKEALSINVSLTALGKVIVALDPTQQSNQVQHIPYRDSKLTRLLQNSLGGNSFTVLLATIHPMTTHYSECLSTLQFANRCRNVRNQPRVNYITEGGMANQEKRLKRLMGEISQLKRSLSSIELRHQRQIATLMSELGIEGEVLPDGRFQTATGEVIGVTSTQAAAAVASQQGGGDGALGEAGGLVSTSGIVGAGGGGFVAGAGSRAALQLGKGAGARAAQMQRQLVSEQKEKERMQRRLEAAKDEMQRLQEDATNEKNRLTQHVRRQHDQLAQLREEMEEYRSTAEEALAKERVTHDKNIADLMRNNNHIMKRTAKHVAQVPHSLRVRSAAIAQAREAEGRVREEMIKARDALVADMKRGQLLELENMKQQYEFLAKKKTEEQDKLVEDFNNYHKRKTLQLNEYKDELVLLYQHCCALSTMVEKMENNAYPIRSIRTGVRTFAIPPEDRPREIFKDPARLKHLREQLKISRKGVKSLKEMENSGLPRPAANAPEVTAAAAHPAAPAAAVSRPPSRSAVASNGSRGAAYTSQITSEALARTTTDDYDLPLLFPRGFDNPRGKDGDAAAADNDDDIDLEATLSQLDGKQLEKEIMALRKYIRGGLRRRVEEQVLNDLADHPTVEYIKAVEDEREHYKSLLAEEAKKHRQLRIAYQAQVRAIDKVRRRRPRTAATSRSSSTRPWSARSVRSARSAPWQQFQ
eukprot:g4004.t1